MLPAADADTAMSILGSRIRQAAIGVPARILDAFDEHNREYFEHSANRQLATVTVITGTRDPAATADLIAERLAVRPT